MTRPLRVAVVGAGPAGIYASDLLMKSEHPVQVDLFEKMPAPFGLIRYGVAPDHPRIKGIIKSLHNVLDKPEVRLLGNITIGEDITVEELRSFYDAIIFSTGAVADRDLNIPGKEMRGHYGAGQFVGFYDGNPYFSRDWDLSAEQVAVVGVGNVGLDISRVLAKTADEMLVTEIPDNVYANLSRSAAREIHIFGRRGPAQAKFTPLELKELDHSPNVEVIVDPEDIDYDAASEEARRASKSVDLVCQTLENYAIREPKGAPHKIFIHFFESPVEILGDEDGNVTGFITERTELDGTGDVRGTGKKNTWPVQAVYRAVGYRSEPVKGVPFDETAHIMPNDGGHILAADGKPLPGLYATGWIKRGPIGLIGNTKSDAKETTEILLQDYATGKLSAPENPAEDAIIELLEARNIEYTTWDGWHQLDAAERAAGAAEGRERKKYVEVAEMLEHSRVEES